MKTAGRIVVVGGLNMDLHLFDMEGSSGQAPMIADRYLAQPGGKGANVARAAARLGANVSLVGRIGADQFGHDCLAAVSNDGVDTKAVVATADEPTGFVAIELAEGRHRSLIFAAGANDALTWDDIEPSLHGLGPDDIVIAQAEVPAVALSQLAGFAAQHGIPLFLDPTPPTRIDRHLLATAEVITPDLSEAAQLVGRHDTSNLWPELAARELLSAGFDPGDHQDRRNRSAPRRRRQSRGSRVGAVDPICECCQCPVGGGHRAHAPFPRIGGQVPRTRECTDD